MYRIIHIPSGEFANIKEISEKSKSKNQDLFCQLISDGCYALPDNLCHARHCVDCPWNDVINQAQIEYDIEEFKDE